MDLARIQQAAKAYQGNVDASTQAQLDLMQALWGICARSSARVAPYRPAAPEARQAYLDRLKTDFEQGIPFMSDNPICVDAESLADVVETLRACVVDSGAYPKEFVSSIQAINLRQVVMVSDMDLASVDPEAYLNSLVEAMQAYGIDGATVTLLVGLVSLGLRSLQGPAAQEMMEDAGEACADGSAHANCCPVCGGRPTMAVLVQNRGSKGTGRKLACVQCGTEWEYDRFRCPHCRTTDISKLGYRTLKHDSRHRIDYCDECGNYIRTVVIPTANSAYSIDVEDCVMASMDSYAMEKQAEPEA